MAKQKDVNLYYMGNRQASHNDAKEEERKRKEREKRIRENKKKEYDSEFDESLETAIQMTNRNKIKKEEERRKIQNKEAIKRKKKKKKIKFLIKIFVSIGLVSGGTAFALISPIFNVKEIRVTKNNIIPSETIVSLSELKIGENIFRFLKIPVIKNIKTNSYIEDVKVHRKLPNIIELEIEERIPKYSVKLLESYAYINTQGYILEISEDSKEMPVIQGLKTPEEEITEGNRLNTEDLEKLEDIIKIIYSTEKHNLNERVTTIDIDKKNEYSIYIAEQKKTIHLGNCTCLNDKIRNAVKIIEKEKDVEGDIFVNGDFNNGFQPYFRQKV